MRKYLVPLLTCAMLFALLGTFAAPAEAAGLTRVPAVSAQQVPAKNVISTLYSGDFSDVHGVVEGLYELAAAQGLSPVDKSVTFVYLGEDRTDNRVTEIQIEVTGQSLDHAKSDPMALDRAAADFGLTSAEVKTTVPTRVIAASKDKGVGDPTDIYTGIYSYLSNQGLDPKGAPQEVFADSTVITEQCVYATLETEIQVAY